MTLPNFLIIGAGRAGTTSLHHYLRQHPDVFVPAAKEPSFFAFMDGGPPLQGPGAEWFRRVAVRTLREYEGLFAGVRARAIGEVSPIYLVDAAVPARVRSVVPDVRLIAILRQPVERAHAAYLQLRRDGQEPAKTFEEAIAEEERRVQMGWSFAGLVRHGFYHRLLLPWFELFPRDQLCVCLYDDLLRDPLGLMRDLFAFIGADPHFRPDVTRRHAATGLPRNAIVRALWMRSATARALFRRWLPEPWRDRAFELVTRNAVKPALSPRTRADLIERYRPDIIALQQLIGRDLSAWLK